MDNGLFFNLFYEICVHELLALTLDKDILGSDAALRRITEAYFSSSSIMKQALFVCSQAIIVEPEPPKVSITIALSCEELQIGYPRRSSGLLVGWLALRFGLS